MYEASGKDLQNKSFQSRARNYEQVNLFYSLKIFTKMFIEQNNKIGLIKKKKYLNHIIAS